MLYLMVIISSAYDKPLGRYGAKDGRTHISFCRLRYDADVGVVIAIHLLYACAKFGADRARGWRVMAHALKPARAESDINIG